MATDRRVARVAELIRREISQMVMSGIKDDRVGMGMVSITDVKLSGDMQHAKVFVSIYGSDEAREGTMAGLLSATSYVRSELGRRVRLRRTPEVLFVEDRSLERGTEVLGLINRLTDDRKTSGVEEWLNQPEATPENESEAL
jgi:ribosome-binding factor A